MGLQINTNIAALNAQRNLSVTNRKLGNLFEQLSSGLRVNRAADDAAGLAISEKMRAQIHGMQQGQRNAQDGISMLQTTEGALNEVHAILQRLRELAVQAGNTTLSSSDRQAIGEEALALRSEVDNIAVRTRFNGQSSRASRPARAPGRSCRCRARSLGRPCRAPQRTSRATIRTRQEAPGEGASTAGGSGVRVLIEGTCTYGGGFLRRSCGQLPIGQCVYCGEVFCDRHGELGPEFHQVCSRPACQAKYKDVHDHLDWIEAHRGPNSVSMCAEELCQERMQHSCQRCQLRFCDEHLRVRQVLERREKPPRQVALLLCAHCTARRRLWD